MSVISTSYGCLVTSLLYSILTSYSCLVTAHRVMSVLPGPTKKSVVDFWRMVWEKQVVVVVMITKCVELGKHKCLQYWPDNGSTTYGGVVVRVAKTQKCDGYDLRTIRLQSEVHTHND